MKREDIQGRLSGLTRAQNCICNFACIFFLRRVSIERIVKFLKERLRISAESPGPLRGLNLRSEMLGGYYGRIACRPLRGLKLRSEMLGGYF